MGGVLSLHRGYSPVESLFYDNLIAPGTVVAARPVLDEVAARTPSGGRVLDVGCGGGQALVTLAGLRPDLRLVGVDPSASLARRATNRSHGGGHTDVVQGSAVDLPFQDDGFDFVFSLFTIKHWPDQGRGLAECVRVTRPGGRLIMTELDGSASRARWKAMVGLTRIPARVFGGIAAPALSPIVRRLVEPDDVRRQLEQLPVSDVVLTRDPNLAVVRLDATSAK